MRIGIVTDIHFGPDVETRLGSRAPALVREVAAALRSFSPACVVDLGDRINDTTPDEDRERTVAARRGLLDGGAPVYHLLGNHDVVNVSKAGLSAALGKRAPYEVVDLDGVRLVLLDSQDPNVERIGGTLGREQLAWFAERLRETRLPCLVFCHHPLDEQALDGHFYFEGHPTHAHARGRAEARAIIERAGNVVAVFSGHMHWSRSSVINGVPYVTLGSLVDAGFTGGRPCGAYAKVAMDETAIQVRVAGLLPACFGFRRP